MNDINFFSKSKYIFLPTKNNPKVALSIDNFSIAKNAFKLYNPFSSKAKLFKRVVMFFYLYFNLLGNMFATKKEKSKFVKYLETLLQQPLIVSIYYATINDKVVLQLQSLDAKVIGYLKYPLNEIGLKHINNEIEAYALFSSLKIVEPYMLAEFYNDVPFLLLNELDGEIGLVGKNYLNIVLEKLKREDKYKLANHPRILEMQKVLLEKKMLEYQTKVEKIVANSKEEYKLVYEHGDFTPWNFVKVKENYIPFDFEYFTKDGLEYFDIIKYYYQVGKLLEGKDANELIEFIATYVNIEELESVLQLFLIKEIIKAKEESEVTEFEEKMLKILEKR